MSQLSRPLLLGFALLALFAGAWFLVLHRPSSEAGSSSPTANGPVYHGAAPGVEGLTKDIAKAHGAVRVSEANAQALKEKSAMASGEASSSGGTAARHPSTKTKPATKSSGRPGTPRGAASHDNESGGEARITHDLAHHRVVALLFWNEHGFEDQAVRSELQSLAHHDSEIAVQTAHASQVSNYGGYTRGVQVNQTPTILLINGRTQAMTVTGLTDESSIRQAIGEATKGTPGEPLSPTFTAWHPGSPRALALTKEARVCHKWITFKLSPSAFTSVASLKQGLRGFHALVVSGIGQIERSVPTPDRPFVKHMFAAAEASGRELVQAINAPGYREARALALSAQAKFDEAVNGFERYGFTGC